MARSKGVIDSTVWDDKDFCSISRSAQGTYWFLVGQRDLSHAGVIPLREGRWAKSSSDGRADLDADLAELEAARFIVIDRAEGELLVRSLMRRDKVYRQPNVMLAAVDAVQPLASRRILAELLTEVDRIEAENHDLSEPMQTSLAKMRQALARRLQELGGYQPVEGSENPSGNPSAIASPNDSANLPGERGVVTVRTTDSPVPRSPFPDPQPALVDLPAATSKTKPSADPKAAFDTFWEIYPRRESKGAAKTAWAKAIKKAPVEDILTGARAYRDDKARKGSEARFTKLPATWLNAECWTDDRTALSRASPDSSHHQSYRNPQDASIYEGNL